eukprot:jgi/Phyca11/18521/fgenesh1_pg.PHYCAscaffold_37_\
MVDAAAAQSRCDELAREWLFNCDFWYREVGQALNASDEVEKRLKSEMQDLKTRYQDHIDSLETDKTELKARLVDAEAHIRLLNDCPVTKAIDTWGFAEFLQKKADVSGNWDRLHELLELYQDNATMLVSMMYWRRLDATPWSSYVPEVYYKMADERLDRLLNLDQLAPSWEPLDAHVPYPDEDVESTADDTTAGPDFKAPPSDGSPSEGEDDGDDSDSGSESDGHTHRRPKRSRSQSSSDTDAPAPPPKKSKAYKRASSGYQRQQTTRRQVTKNPSSGSSSRRRSLSHKAYDSLTVDELQVVEVPDDSVLSWLYFGVRVQRVSVSKSYLGQTAGFPDSAEK